MKLASLINSMSLDATGFENGLRQAARSYRPLRRWASSKARWMKRQERIAKAGRTKEFDMLFSKLEEIRRLRMTQLRSQRPMKCEAIVTVGTTTVIRLPRNRWWSTWRNFSKRAFNENNDYGGKVTELLTGLARLKLLPLSVVDEHLDRMKRLSVERERADDAKWIREIAGRHGKSFVRKAIKPLLELAAKKK